MNISCQISVIVALNPHDNDPYRVFDAYLRQTAKLESFEVIFVDSRARNAITDALTQQRNVLQASPMRLIEVDTPGRAAANNAGARAARADLLLFVADDFLPGRTLVRSHVEFHRCLADTNAVGFGPAFFLDALREDPFRRWLEDSGRLFSVPFRMPAGAWLADFFYVGNASMHRALFDSLGGFDETFQEDLGDDFEFGLRMRRAGVRSHFLPKAVAWHDHAVTLEERLVAEQRNGAMSRYTGERHGMRPQWLPIMSRTLKDLETAVLRAEKAESIASSPDTRAARYEALLDFAFMRGYQAADTDTVSPAAEDLQPVGSR